MRKSRLRQVRAALFRRKSVRRKLALTGKRRLLEHLKLFRLLRRRPRLAR